MSTSAQLKDFLHHTLFSKFKVKLTLQQFNDILSQAQRLTKISDQGLILIALVQQLQRQVTLNYVAIKKLIAELEATQKKQKAKKQKNEEDQGPIQRRRKPKNISNEGLNLENLAQQSVSNPSNLQRERQNISGRIGASGLIEDISHSNSQQQSKGSKDSKDSQKQLAYKERLNKITQQLEIPGDTYLTNENIQNTGLQVPSSEDSSNSFGLISNLNEKMKIFDGQKKQEQTRTKKKNEKHHRGTATKKHGFLNMTIDQKLSLQETRVSLNQTIAFNQSKTKVSFQEMHMIDKYQKYSQNIDSNSWFQKFMNLTALQKISEVLVQNKSEPLNNNFNNFTQQNFTNYDNFQTEFNNDYNSQGVKQNNTNSQQIDLFQEQIKSLNSNQKVGLSQLSAKIKKAPSQLFYQMLRLAQIGQVKMDQQKPEQFSEIFLWSS